MTIPVGSAAWYAWLADATSFAFRSGQGTFTAHKERRGSTREYWKAYRRHAGRLHRVYLGKSSEITLDRLNAAAAELARGVSAVPSPHVTSEDTADGPPQAADDAHPLHLLSTKYAIPAARANLVPRPRLAVLLDAAISQGRKLILIAAPAGSGKTTLLV